MNPKAYLTSLLFLSIFFTLHPQSSAQTLATPSAATPATPAASLTTLPNPTSGVNFTLTPSVLTIKTPPGNSSTHTLKIRNNNTQPEAISISLSKVTTSNLGATSIVDFDTNDPLPSWVSLDQKEFMVQPDSWHEITLTFSPPPEAALGYYFAVLFNRALSPEAGVGETAVQGAPAIITLAEVTSDQAVPRMDMLSFTTTKKWYDFLPVEFDITLHNTGNIHLQPIGNIYIDQGSQKDVGLLTINESAGYILPGATRTFRINWLDGFPVYNITTNDQGEVEKNLTWDWSKIKHFRIGKYTATAFAIYDDGTQDISMENTLEFWVIPWQILTLITIIMLVLIIGIIAIVKLLITPFKSYK